MGGGESDSKRGPVVIYAVGPSWSYVFSCPYIQIENKFTKFKRFIKTLFHRTCISSICNVEIGVLNVYGACSRHNSSQYRFIYNVQ